MIGAKTITGSLFVTRGKSELQIASAGSNLLLYYPPVQLNYFFKY